MIKEMYNACTGCEGGVLRLVLDAKCEISKAGGIRMYCTGCGKNTAVAAWNDYNPKESSDEVCP